MAVYSVHIGDNFLQQVLCLVYADNICETQMADTKIFVPNNRLAKALQTEILRKFDGYPTLMPQIVSISSDESVAETVEFYGGDYIAPAVDTMQRQLWLADAVWGYYNISPHLESIAFSVAMEYANQLSRLFDNLHLYEVNFKDFLNCVSDLQPDLSDHWAVSSTFLQHFYPMWQSYLHTQGLSDIGAYRMRCYTHIIETLKISKHRIFCAGFTATYPIIGTLLDTVKNLKNGTVIFPAYAPNTYHQHIQNDPSHPYYLIASHVGNATPTTIPAQRPQRHAICEQAFLPALCTEEWSKIPPVTENTHDIFSGIRFMACESLSIEAMSIALALRHVLETDGKTGALITADKNLSRMVINILRRWKIHIDDSSGTPLHLTPVAVFMQLVLDAQFENFTPTALVKLLKHPLCNMGYDRGDFLRKVRTLEKIALRGYIIGTGIQGIIDSLYHRLKKDRYFLPNIKCTSKKQGIVTELAQFLQHIQQQFAPLTQQNTSLKDFLTAHIQVAENFAGMDTLWAHEDGHTVSQTCARILDISHILEFKHNFTLGDYKPFFTSLLYGKTVRKMYGMHPRLYIWGTLEGRLQTVDTVIFGGCNEGTLPTITTADIWVSNTMAQAIKLPTIDRSVGVSAHDVLSACNGDTVIFSRAIKHGGTQTIPSRWWQRFEAISKAYGVPLPVPETDYTQLATHIDTVDDNIRQSVKISVPKPTPPVHMRPTKLSMTNIQTWYEDPYQIYARHVLKLHKMDDLATDSNPAFKGTLVHAILEDFAKKYAQQYFADKNSIDKIQALQDLCTIADTHFDMYQGVSDVTLQIIPEFYDFAPKFIDAFYKRLHDTTHMYFEKYGTYTLQTKNKNTFIISGIADRIDITDKGNAIIVDYKTGAKIRPTLVKNGTAPQLILQAYMAQQGGYAGMEKSVFDTAEYWMTKRTFEIVSHETETILDTALQRLHTQIDTYADENTPYYTLHRTGKSVTYNNYAHLFRESEWNTTEGDT